MLGRALMLTHFATAIPCKLMKAPLGTSRYMAAGMLLHTVIQLYLMTPSPWLGCLPTLWQQACSRWVPGEICFLPGAHCWLVQQGDSTHPPPSFGREKLILEGSPDSQQPEVQLVWMCLSGWIQVPKELWLFPAWFSRVMKVCVQCHWRSGRGSHQASGNVCASGALWLNISPCLQRPCRPTSVSLCSWFDSCAPMLPKASVAAAVVWHWHEALCCERTKGDAMPTAQVLLPWEQPPLEMWLMANPEVAPGLRVLAARDTARQWQVARAQVLQTGLIWDGAPGADGTLLRVPCPPRALPCPSQAAVWRIKQYCQ